MQNMTIAGWILGVLIVFNVIFSFANHNWDAELGWFVAFLEWRRRFGG